MFSSLGPRIYGSQVLELFAGTGAFGLEAISRGAARVVLVERDKKAVEALVRTVRSFKVDECTVVWHMDALKALGRLEKSEWKFGIVFLDPPYGEDWPGRLLSDPRLLDVVVPHGLVIVERSAAAGELNVPTGFEKSFSRTYGRTHVEMIERA